MRPASPTQLAFLRLLLCHGPSTRDQGPGVSHSGAALGPRKHPVHKDTDVHPRAVQGMQSDSEDRVRPRTALGKDVADWEDQKGLPRGSDAGTET